MQLFRGGVTFLLLLGLVASMVAAGPGLSSGSGVPSAAGSFQVSGNVTDTVTLFGVSSATVQASGGQSTVTNSTGGFSLTVPRGTVTFQVSGPGYFTLSRVLTVTATTTDVVFALRPHTYPVKGSVLSEAASLPIPGSVVTAAWGAYHARQTVGGGGQFVLFLENGTYTLTAQTPGYRTMTLPLTVNGAPVTQYFLLELNSTTTTVNLGTLLPLPVRILGAGAIAGAATAGVGVAVARRRARLPPGVTPPIAGMPSQRGPEDVASARAIARREAHRRFR